jgi:hypothetical protein
VAYNNLFGPSIYHPQKSKWNQNGEDQEKRRGLRAEEGGCQFGAAVLLSRASTSTSTATATAAPTPAPSLPLVGLFPSSPPHHHASLNLTPPPTPTPTPPLLVLPPTPTKPSRLTSGIRSPSMCTRFSNGIRYLSPSPSPHHMDQDRIFFATCLNFIVRSCHVFLLFCSALLCS